MASEHKKREAWIGDGAFVEELRDTPAGTPYELVGTAQSRWLPGGFHSEWRQRGVARGRELGAVEIDGYDYAQKLHVGTS